MAVAFTAVAVVPVTSVKDVFAVMVPMRVLLGMPVPCRAMPASKPVVFAQATVD